MIVVDVYVILVSKNGQHMYVTCFISRKEAEEYVFNHSQCYVRHETREIK